MKMTLAISTVLCAAAVSTVAVAAKPTTRNRAEIPAEFRWDFAAIYPSWDAWEAGMKDMDAKMDAFAALKGTLASGVCRRPPPRWSTAMRHDAKTRGRMEVGRRCRPGAGNRLARRWLGLN